MVLVVICFHFTIFVVLETTRLLLGNIAFSCDLLSFTIFVVLETTRRTRVYRRRRCDLLSFYYLCRTGNNMYNIPRTPKPVVICFHFTIFVVLETTYLCAYVRSVLL